MYAHFRGQKKNPVRGKRFKLWYVFARLTTILVPDFVLSCFGMKTQEVRNAWREKIALCTVITVFCMGLGFVTYGMSRFVCKYEKERIPFSQLKKLNKDPKRNYYTINGVLYNLDKKTRFFKKQKLKGYRGQDISSMFLSDSSCRLSGIKLGTGCTSPTGKPMRCLKRPVTFSRIAPISYTWDDIKKLKYSVFNSMVLDLSHYEKGQKLMLDSDSDSDSDEGEARVTKAPKTKRLLSSTGYPNKFSRLLRRSSRGSRKNDKTSAINNDVIGLSTKRNRLRSTQRIEKRPPFEKDSDNLSDSDSGSDSGSEEEVQHLDTNSFPPELLSELQNSAGRDLTQTLSRYGPDVRECISKAFKRGYLEIKSYGCLFTDVVLYSSFIMIMSIIVLRFTLAVAYSWYIAGKVRRVTPPTMNTILLVTCYSEGEAELKVTIDSLAAQDYPDERKLILCIADGQITGAGNDSPTPDLLLGLIRIDKRYRCEPRAYVAIDNGPRRTNRGVVYAGHYCYGNRTIPAIVISKVGAEGESYKPGNRGKRDSQLILMEFMNKVYKNDRMSPLEIDLFDKIVSLTKFSPDSYEAVLMIDADTWAHPSALINMVTVLEKDEDVSGMCGETRILNKTQSFVTMIQVFEYYISHHLTKSFESVFGTVTCLPGCFCLYRLRVVRNDVCVPILASSRVISEYSDNVTDTLHKKNLLLLGEDRYLTTLMLKIFPKRKLVFLPNAISETQVPYVFGVLLSQRRRWINSTIHNLFELVQVRNTCGSFCCSMQFVILVELFGTLVLPAAIVFTFVLVMNAILFTPEWVPLLLLAAILGLPGVLILLTAHNLVYVFWLVVYILALPVWNFILPVYSFWHFDDFSWGETRKVEGGTLDEAKQEGCKEVKFEHYKKSFQETV